jgi:hypothetical protein
MFNFKNIHITTRNILHNNKDYFMEIINKCKQKIKAKYIKTVTLRTNINKLYSIYNKQQYINLETIMKGGSDLKDRTNEDIIGINYKNSLALQNSINILNETKDTQQLLEESLKTINHLERAFRTINETDRKTIFFKPFIEIPHMKEDKQNNSIKIEPYIKSALLKNYFNIDKWKEAKQNYESHINTGLQYINNVTSISDTDVSKYVSDAKNAIISLKEHINYIETHLNCNDIEDLQDTDFKYAKANKPNLMAKKRNFFGYRTVLDMETKITSTSGGSSITNILDPLFSKRVVDAIKYNHKINESIVQLKNTYIKFNKYYLWYNAYIVFLFNSLMKYMIAEHTNQYKFLNRGTIETYSKIFNDMFNEITDPNPTPVNKFLNTNYYMVILKLREFFNKLKTLITDPNTYIDISTTIQTLSRGDDREQKLRDAIRVYTNLFNDFREKADNWSLQMQPRAQIVCRINNMINTQQRVEYVDPNKDQFLFYSKYYDDKKFDDADNSGVSIRSICDDVTNTATDRLIFYFNKVYSMDLPDNENVAENMGLKVMLENKKNIMLATYGYSGVGKSYTLFGRNDEQINENGLLSFVLQNIEPQKLKLRVFEYYGIGIPYKFYWTEKHNIMQKIYNHELDVKHIGAITYLGHTGITTPVTGLDFDNFLVSDNYTPIPDEHIKDVLDNFRETYNEVDDVRKTEGRVYPTPNNDKSSRSILIYDIVFTIDGHDTRLLILDLPGRESIETTYIEPYFTSVGFREVMNNNDEYFSEAKIYELKLAIISMALNPMMLSIFYYKEIIEYCKSIGNEHVDTDDSSINTFSKLFLDQIWSGKLKVKDFFTSDYQYISNRNLTGVSLNTLSGVVGRPYPVADSNYVTSFALQILATILMKVLIERGQLEKLLDIFEVIIENHLNRYVFDAIDSMDDSVAEIIMLYDELESENGDTVKETIKKHYKYKYIRQAVEGIYINENITSLFNIITNKELLGESITEEQINKIKEDFIMTHKSSNYFYWMARKTISINNFFKDLTNPNHTNHLKNAYTETLPNADEKKKLMLTPSLYYYDSQSQNILLNDEKILVLIEQIYALYNSNKVYNSDNSLFKTIIDHYSDRSKNPNGFYLRIIHLLANQAATLQRKNCKGQLELLAKSSNIRNLLTGKREEIERLNI